MLPRHAYGSARGASEGRRQGCTSNDLAVIQEDWTACRRAWGKARARSHVLTEPCWSQQLMGKPLRRQRSPAAPSAGVTVRRWHRQAPWHAWSLLCQDRKFSPQPYPNCLLFLASGHSLPLQVPLVQLPAELHCEMSWVKNQ